MVFLFNIVSGLPVDSSYSGHLTAVGTSKLTKSWKNYHVISIDYSSFDHHVPRVIIYTAFSIAGQLLGITLNQGYEGRLLLSLCETFIFTPL
jgi:hypothetical protein